jgi:hypothetical protein
MAIVVIGALLSSTVLTLVVVPALYTIFDDLQVRLFGAKRQPVVSPKPEVEVSVDAPVLSVRGGREANGHPEGNWVVVVELRSPETGTVERREVLISSGTAGEHERDGTAA